MIKKPQIQALKLDRPAPTDDPRHSRATATSVTPGAAPVDLFAALDAATGKMIGELAARRTARTSTISSTTSTDRIDPGPDHPRHLRRPLHAWSTDGVHRSPTGRAQISRAPLTTHRGPRRRIRPDRAVEGRTGSGACLEREQLLLAGTAGRPRWRSGYLSPAGTKASTGRSRWTKTAPTRSSTTSAFTAGVFSGPGTHRGLRGRG